jgi:hypothetical protein
MAMRTPPNNFPLEMHMEFAMSPGTETNYFGISRSISFFGTFHSDLPQFSESDEYPPS